MKRMINKINTVSTNEQISSKKVAKYSITAMLGASAGVGYAVLPRTYYPKFIKKTENKIALVQYIKNPYKYGLYGVLTALVFTALVDCLKFKKQISKTNKTP